MDCRNAFTLGVYASFTRLLGGDCTCRRHPPAAATSSSPLEATRFPIKETRRSPGPILNLQELLVCVAGFQHFRHMLEGRWLRNFTDHKPLMYALSRMSDLWSAHQARQLSYLAEHTDDIQRRGQQSGGYPVLPAPLGGYQCKRALQASGGRLAGRQPRIFYTIRIRVPGAK
jgi:hypothetical protein